MSELRVRLPQNGVLYVDTTFSADAKTHLEVYDLDNGQRLHKISNYDHDGKNPWPSPQNTEDRYKVYLIKTEFKSSNQLDEWKPHNMQVLEIGTNRSVTYGLDDTENPDYDYNDCVYTVSIGPPHTKS